MQKTNGYDDETNSDSFVGITVALLHTSSTSVQGEITDSKQLPIEGATVVGLDAKDSSFVQGTVTREQGHFTLPPAA